jgi:predicted CoA-substrate-specific enzyme activase
VRAGGFDIGSRYIKYVVLEDGREHLFYKEETGYDPLGTCRSFLAETKPDAILATGYGRHLLSVESNIPTITEIKAVAKGARHFFPTCRTILDIGGQDTKVVQLDEKGAVSNFEMNDRCAAGTGKFLEIMAKALGYEMEAFGNQCGPGGDRIAINSLCTVFAESEVIGLIAKGVKRESISAALHQSVVTKVAPLLKRMGVKQDIVFAGGCARNACLRQMLEEKMGQPLLVHENPDMLTAYGAALAAKQSPIINAL